MEIHFTIEQIQNTSFLSLPLPPPFPPSFQYGEKGQNLSDAFSITEFRVCWTTKSENLFKGKPVNEYRHNCWC